MLKLVNLNYMIFDPWFITHILYICISHLWTKSCIWFRLYSWEEQSYQLHSWKFSVSFKEADFFKLKLNIGWVNSLKTARHLPFLIPTGEHSSEWHPYDPSVDHYWNLEELYKLRSTYSNDDLQMSFWSDRIRKSYRLHLSSLSWCFRFIFPCEHVSQLLPGSGEGGIRIR